MTDGLVRAATSQCSTCKRSVGATLWRSQGRILIPKHCPQHRTEQVVVSSNAAWFDTINAGPVNNTGASAKAPDGANMPSRAYNVLYRNRDERFVLSPVALIATLGAGRWWPSKSD